MFTKKARQALYSLHQSRQSTVCGLTHYKRLDFYKIRYTVNHTL